MAERLEDLQALRADLKARLETCESDQNFAVMGRLLTDVVKQIEEIEKAVPSQKGTVLDELAKRRSAPGSRSAAESQ